MHRRPAQPAAVDDAGVVQLVAVDRVPFADQGRDRADVGRVAGGKEQRRFGPFELGQLSLQFRVQIRLRPVTSGLAPVPQPYWSIAARTAAAIRGSAARPR